MSHFQNTNKHDFIIIIFETMIIIILYRINCTTTADLSGSRINQHMIVCRPGVTSLYRCHVLESYKTWLYMSIYVAFNHTEVNNNIKIKYWHERPRKFKSTYTFLEICICQKLNYLYSKLHKGIKHFYIFTYFHII